MGARSPSAAAWESALARARTRWPPEVTVDADAFARFVAERIPEGDDPDAALASLHVDELYLCCACLAGSPAAVAELEHQFVAEAARALGRLGLSSAERDEALQLAREKILTASPEAPPRLAQFSGQGSLAGWMRVVVVRAGLNLRRDERRHAPRDDELLATRIAGEADDPELDIIKSRYADALAQAVAEAFRRLTSEQRNLLRMYVIDGLTLGDLGRLHDVDQSTISRWLAKIRANLLAEARGWMLERLALRPSECDSLMRVVRSELHVTVERLLGTEPGGSAD